LQTTELELGKQTYLDLKRLLFSVRSTASPIQ